MGTVTSGYRHLDAGEVPTNEYKKLISVIN
jgi:hypothetical protein